MLRKPRGFTLIELLIVIAVLGVLAAVVLVAINPVEQLARARDAGRKTALSQLSKAVQAYYTSRNATYPVTADGLWITELVRKGDVNSIPSAIIYAPGTSACPTRMQSNYCFDYNDDASGLRFVVIYVMLESQLEKSKCIDPTKPLAAFVWSSKDARAGVVCWSTDAQLGTSVLTGYTYVE